MKVLKNLQYRCIALNTVYAYRDVDNYQSFKYSNYNLCHGLFIDAIIFLFTRYILDFNNGAFYTMGQVMQIE
jgi:hypothetical protein